MVYIGHSFCQILRKFDNISASPFQRFLDVSMEPVPLLESIEDSKVGGHVPRVNVDSAYLQFFQDIF